MIERSEAGKAVETTVFARHRREGLAADEIGDVSNIDQYVGYPTCQMFHHRPFAASTGG
jgi:hypothetical protein